RQPRKPLNRGGRNPRNASRARRVQRPFLGGDCQALDAAARRRRAFQATRPRCRGRASARARDARCTWRRAGHAPAPTKSFEEESQPAKSLRLRPPRVAATRARVACEVRLFEHDEFDQAVIRAAQFFNVSEQFVEKDYYVTEILRIIGDELGEKAMFKGGTSLSKGWKLINRFSEDIDLFVDRDKFEPPAGVNKMDRILKDLSELVAQH